MVHSNFARLRPEVLVTTTLCWIEAITHCLTSQFDFFELGWFLVISLINWGSILWSVFFTFILGLDLSLIVTSWAVEPYFDLYSPSYALLPLLSLPQIIKYLLWDCRRRFDRGYLRNEAHQTIRIALHKTYKLSPLCLLLSFFLLGRKNSMTLMDYGTLSTVHSIFYLQIQSLESIGPRYLGLLIRVHAANSSPAWIPLIRLNYIVTLLCLKSLAAIQNFWKTNVHLALEALHLNGLFRLLFIN